MTDHTAALGMGETPPAPREFQPEINEDAQQLSIFNMIGAAMEGRGGPTLMLTEFTENCSDAIIKAIQKGIAYENQIRLRIDKEHQKITVIDDGTGILDVEHTCKKPFKSLKAGDDTQTGKFARGLHAFRAFCSKLTYISKRATVPEQEQNWDNSPGITRKTVKISFTNETPRAKAIHVSDDEFAKYSKAPHGTVAILEDWKPGMFDKVSVEQVIGRIQYHFGEHIRKREVSIIIEVEKGKIAGIGPRQGQSVVCEPIDYSQHAKIDIPSINYEVNGKQVGKINFNLHLSSHARSDRYGQPQPFLLYKNRPVGDLCIGEFEDFVDDHPVWRSSYLTGYVTCDFCEINELRTALKVSIAREFLYKQLKKVEHVIQKKIKEHQETLSDLKLREKLSDLVLKLQKFLRDENIFKFSKAQSEGSLSEDEEVEVVTLASQQGLDETKDAPSATSTATAMTDAPSTPTPAVPAEDSDTVPRQHTDVITCNPPSQGGVTPATPQANGSAGSTQNQEGATARTPEQIRAAPGGQGQSSKKARRRRPRGYGMEPQENEFREEPSWFEEGTFTVIINTANPRWKTRFTPDQGVTSRALNYMAELYIWEISKMAFKKEPDKIGWKFINLKNKYFEEQNGSKPAA